MWKKIFTAAIAGTLLMQIPPASAQTPPAPANLEELDRALEALLKEGQIPGAAVALVENGEITFAKGYGFADLDAKTPATADTPFRAGSISKTLTSIAIMTLVDQGKLALDAPVKTLLPGLPFTNPWEATDPLRLAHLLEHTAGWPDIGPAILAKDEKDWTGAQGVEFAKSVYVSRWKPGHFTNYNNAGPAVAAQALEKITGQRFENYVRDSVLRPMGMKIADFDLTPELAGTIAKSYDAKGVLTPYQHIVLKPSGSLNASARELAELVRFYLGRGTVNGQTILSPAAVERTERSETNIASAQGMTMSYGLGNAPIPDKGPAFRGHNGGIDGFTSVFGYSLATNAGYILFANGGDGVDFGAPAASLIQHYLSRKAEARPPVPVPLDPAAGQAFAGFYETITPPNALLQPIGLIATTKFITAGPDRLVVNGREHIHVGGNLFQSANREIPGFAYLQTDDGTFRVGAFGAEKKIPAWRMGVKAFVLLAAVFGTLFGLVMIIPWLRAMRRDQLAARGGAAIRLLPLLGLAGFWTAMVLPLLAFFASGTSAVLQLAEIGPYSLTILAASLIYPLAAVGGLWFSAQTSGAGRGIRFYAATVSLALLIAGSYAATINWLPLMSWKM